MVPAQNKDRRGKKALMEEETISYALLRPTRQSAPILYASPHSGNRYPTDFVHDALLDPVSLRRSEDAFVDDLYSDCIRYGSPQLKALYPRAYLDVNREPYELDPSMFDSPLPDFVNVDSPRALAGLGTIAKVVANGCHIYRSKLCFEEIDQRINRIYYPYHDTLFHLLEETVDRFGGALLIDCHSMPSNVQGPGQKTQKPPADIILGDRFETSCANWITNLAEKLLKEEGFSVGRNKPYAGGFTTQHYGTPKKRVHALQIEINRALYMDEEYIVRLPEFDSVKKHLNRFMEKLATLPHRKL